MTKAMVNITNNSYTPFINSSDSPNADLHSVITASAATIKPLAFAIAIHTFVITLYQTCFLLANVFAGMPAHLLYNVDSIIKLSFAFGFIASVNNSYNFELELVRLNRVVAD